MYGSDDASGGGVVMRDKSATLTRVQKLKRRISQSFGRLSISTHEKSEGDNERRITMNGYSDEYLDRIEPNGNIPADKLSYDWRDSRVPRQLSSSSDSKLLDREDTEESVSEAVVMRSHAANRPPRPKSEAYLSKNHNKSHRYSAFGGESPFGKVEAYVKLEQLGEGSYATVYKGYSNLTGGVVALKEIRLQEEEGAPFTAIREASLLKGLKHANIVTLHDIVHTRRSLTFVFEYVHTDLSQYLEVNTGGLQPRNVKLFLFQLLRGLNYCHQRRVLHRDVKPQNLLISEIGELKLADFGLARAKSVPSHTYSHEVVTLWYRPPDVLLGSTHYSTPLDLWAVGCIFIEMLTGQPAFPGIRDHNDQLNKIFRVLGTPSEETWPGIGELTAYKQNKFSAYRTRRLGSAFPRLLDVQYAENLAFCLLQLSPTRRLPASEALLHKYFCDLPEKIFDLPSDTSIFSVAGVALMPEERRHPPAVIKAAQELRKRV